MIGFSVLGKKCGAGAPACSKKIGGIDFQPVAFHRLAAVFFPQAIKYEFFSFDNT
jgi:hypothetical protein